MQLKLNRLNCIKVETLERENDDFTFVNMQFSALNTPSNQFITSP